jgi:hypothetical protein
VTLKSSDGNTTSWAARRVAGQASIAAVDTQAGDTDVVELVAIVEVVAVADDVGGAFVDGGAEVVGGGEVVVAGVDGGAVVPADAPPVLPPHPTSRRSATAGIAAPTRIRLAGVVTARTLPVATVGAAAARRTASRPSTPRPSSADSSQILRGRSGCSKGENRRF